MSRNKEIGLLVAAWSVIGGMGAVFCFSQSVIAGVAALSMVGLLGACYGWFTWWRYREIRRLCVYLSRVYSGGKPMDIRDNREGELSALKNDLYKITCVLDNQAEQLYADKDYLAQALSNISHQLKTPLTGLFVMNDLLQDDSLPPEKRRQFLASCNEQLERIQWLVSSLLTLSRIDAEVIVFKKEELWLAPLLRRAAEPLTLAVEQADITLEIHCPEGLRWQGDSNWTLEAISNIIKNAVEHTPSGGRIVICAAENPLHTEITITDSGSGISEADLPFLFQRFYKGRDAASGSVGIGLALAKTIFQSQNGDVFAANVPDGGAQFTIKLYKQIV